jgi:iron(III) transport system substrate-binding protein
LGAFLFAFAAPAAETTAPWAMDQVEAEARKEGRLVIYAAPGHANRQAQEALSRRFTEKYGVTIEWTSLSAQDIGPRVLAEHRTKQNVADMLLQGIGGSFIEIRARGYLLSMMAPSTLQKGIWRLDPARASPRDRDWLYVNMPLRPSFFYNTQLVKADEVPKSYKDLLLPKWKGKIVLQNPSIGGSGSGWFQATYRELGLDTMKGLAKQVTLVPGVNDVPDAVARGQYPISIAATTDRGQQLIAEGAPVKFAQPKEGSHMSIQGMDILTGGPHPNAAKLFVNWFYTLEGQLLYAPNNRAISVRKDVPQDYIPPEVRYTEGSPFMVASPEDLTAERTRELLNLARQIFIEGK